MKTKRPSKQKKARDQYIPATSQKEFLALYDACRFQDACELAKSLTENYPKDGFAWKVYSSCLLKTGDPDKAKVAAERSISLAPKDGHACHFLARAYHELGNPQEAIKYIVKTIELAPEFSQGYFSAAEIFSESGDFEKAHKHILKAEELGYSNKSCRVLKAHIAVKLGNYSESIGIINELLETDPNNPYLLNDAANLYKDLGQLEAAEELYLKALNEKPDYHTAYFNYIIGKHYNPNETSENITKTIKNWSHHFSENAKPFSHKNRFDDKGKIRIGLISSGFRLHPVGQMITSALEKTTDELELHGYSTNNSNDFLTKRIANRCRTWNLIGKLKPDQLADKIHSDKIDILIDLSGYGDGSRLTCLALKPAPIIVKWVGGLINTTGHPSIDYLISDNYETPADSDDQYTEKLIRMPDDYICYTPPTYAPPITSLPALTNRHVTFGCFNNPSKINGELLEQWATIMHSMPNSRLFLKSIQYSSKEYTQVIYNAMADLGITSDRIDIEGPSKHRELLNAYNRVDIALDTWPYSGGLTTCEAFMMGVPVVTLPGPTFAGRHSATHLINAGMPELVTSSWEEYRQRVIELASDITNLSLIRACLRQFLLQSPVCDAENFGNNFSKAMRAIWKRHCSGLKPEKLSFDNNGLPQFTTCDGDITISDDNKFELPNSPRMSELERQLFEETLAVTNSYFEYGTGGSTVVAVNKGLKVFGVDSDIIWIEELKQKLGNNCKIGHIDIGPTKEWGYPQNNNKQERFKLYSASINEHKFGFDFILVDGRFRVACTLQAIIHSYKYNNGRSKIMIHDFWNRPQYHAVLLFLEHEKTSETAGLFIPRKELDITKVEEFYEQYKNIAD
ncbi:tetratricopeptide repeat protein [Larsenimonas suaedae]|uniref:protein O-GlcNAc transferase n=1 Tax=Larsenimonas suaedae TaxID=1851019 RepID=A0ABU1GUV3_9GAMM|nr:tetratricopeptide repeat protein [Larsenimonas suaedae]MCM2971601.1 tetratricopeptide repeat protein [Larsenimonas suaedae]MDR5895153.1 tetratricopeptide repeat protein [Larsenimonas suaedae]